jgi:hypothetical protein
MAPAIRITGDRRDCIIPVDVAEKLIASLRSLPQDVYTSAGNTATILNMATKNQLGGNVDVLTLEKDAMQTAIQAIWLDEGELHVSLDCLRDILSVDVPRDDTSSESHP